MRQVLAIEAPPGPGETQPGGLGAVQDEERADRGDDGARDECEGAPRAPLVQERQSAERLAGLQDCPNVVYR